MTHAANKVVMRQLPAELPDKVSRRSSAEVKIPAGHQRLPTIYFYRQNDRRLTFSARKTGSANQIAARAVADGDRVALEGLSHGELMPLTIGNVMRDFDSGRGLRGDKLNAQRHMTVDDFCRQ